GLGFVNRLKRQQDDFRARVLFPIFDASGRPVAFGGRALPGGDGPKYKNSRDCALYSKSRILYALNWAKGEVSRTNEVIVCEGYTDVIGFFAAGIPRAVATCGTALADDHFRLLKNFARRIVLAYDADAAGQAAAERFYEWESHYDLDVVVADLPPGADPGQLAEKDPEALRRAVAQARPFLAFRLARALGAADLTTVEGRARAAQTAVDVVAQHPNPLVRDQYLMEVADRCRTEPDRLRQMAADPKRSRSGPGAQAVTRSPVRRRERDGPELEALGLAIHRPEEVAARLEEVLFADETHLAAFRALAGASTLHEALAGAPSEAAALLQRLAVEEPTAEVVDVLSRVVREAAWRALSALEAEVRADPDRAGEAAAAVAWLKRELEILPDLGAVDRLVPWLVRWGEESA
ncbi:MAG: toprim domain-containing protein, partial [Acidimicrobiales bacterium]